MNDIMNHFIMTDREKGGSKEKKFVVDELVDNL